jgi:hypothetical protein
LLSAFDGHLKSLKQVRTSHECVWLFERGEVSALLNFVEVDEIGKSLLGPSPGCPENFFGENRAAPASKSCRR